MIHICKIDSYQIFAHNPSASDISDGIREVLATKRTSIQVKLSPIEQESMEQISFDKRCIKYFEQNFEILATKFPLTLPCEESKEFKEIVKTMGDWCSKTNTSCSMKGLVLHSFPVFRHLEHYGFTREVLKEHLKIEEFSKAPVIIVYNPSKNMILLIRNAEKQDLAIDIKLGLYDLKMFILLFHDELKYSYVKLISIVVTDKEHTPELKCRDCINNVLSLENVKDLHLFEYWLNKRETYFEKIRVGNINVDFIKTFLAKITGTVAATFIYRKLIPTMTDDCNEQMENLVVLMTRKQMEILYSQHKHIIVRGGFGCGKTIIAAAMLKKISENLKNDEKLYYICYDPRSELLSQITENTQKKTDANITPYHNKERRNLSEIMINIFQQESSKKINFVVDEYDGEDLGEIEASRLNELFNGSLKQSFVLLIVQPIEKKRVINNTNQQKNKFDLLEKMEVHQLDLVMRNSVEIHNLIKVTMDLLQKQETVFIYRKNDVPMHRNNTVGELSKTRSKTGSDISTELPSRKRDPLEYHKENSSIPKLGLDEAQAVTESVLKKDDGVFTNFLNATARVFGYDRSVEENKTKTSFLYAEVDKTGHKINTKKPVLWEVGGKSDFEKVISLVAIFEERQLKRGEHVVLHFDIATNAIPDTFHFVFKHHFKIEEKITNNYKAFKSREKSILICSYPTFRGLEHPKITVVIDGDINYVKHYLVETLARCTTDLCIVVLQNSSTLKKITRKWKNKQVIEQWNIKISKDAVGENFKTELKIENRHINAKFSFEYYKMLEKEFDELVTEDKFFQYKDKLEARKTLR